MRILVLVAHPDDEVLGMGGTILRHAQKGDYIKVIYFTTGITSRRSTDYRNNTLYEQNEKKIKSTQKQIEDLRKDAKKSCKILRVNDIEFYDL